MDDLKIIVWIVIGLIYFFARRKKKEEPAPRTRPAPRQQKQETVAAPRSGPKSFEELLREIEGMKQPSPPPTYRPEPEVVDYDDDIPDEKVNYDDILPDYRKQETYQTYEAARTQAFARPALEDTVKLEDTIVRFTNFKGYEMETKRNLLGDYVQELKNPQSFKKAFILSEILRPKF